MPKHSKIQEQSFEDFFQRFVLAESLHKAERGIVFMGNTRAGKSTLTCAAAGSRMELFYDLETGQTELLPCDQKFKGLVTTSLQSVTEKPNFFPINNKCAVIDMPGYADSSRFRELINFHYITKMISNLKQIRFVMVIGVIAKQGGSFTIDKHEIKMMEAFMNMFPNCSKYVTLIVNKITHNGAKDFDSRLKTYLKGIFRGSEDLSEFVDNHEVMSKYYSNLIDNIVVIKRPPFKSSPEKKKSWTEPHKEIGNIMAAICNNNNAQFINAQQLLLQTKFNFFKEGDNDKNERIKQKVQQIMSKIHGYIREALRAYKISTLRYMENILKHTKWNIQKDVLSPFLREIEMDVIKREPDRAQLPSYHLAESALVQTYSYLTSQNNYSFERLFQIVREHFSHLLSVSKTFNKDNASTSIKELQIFIVRCLEMSVFIRKAITGENEEQFLHKKSQNKKGYQAKKDNPLTSQILKYIRDIPQSIKYIKVMENADEYHVRMHLKSLVSFFLTLNLKDQFKNIEFGKIHKDELIISLETIKRDYLGWFGEDLSQQQQIAINKKIKEVELYYVLHSPVEPISPIKPLKPQPNDKNIILKELLKYYSFAESKEAKFRIALRVTAHLQHQKEYKKAIGLFFHLQLYEKVMNMLLAITGACGPEEAVDWYYQLAMEFEAKRRTIYFQLCIEKAKALASPETLIDLHYRLLHGSTNLVNGQSILFKDLKLLQQKLQLWSWKKIDDEISWLCAKYKLQERISKVPQIVARKLRQN